MVEGLRNGEWKQVTKFNYGIIWRHKAYAALRYLLDDVDIIDVDMYIYSSS